ncbi:MAG: prolyl-tRNA synthetase associated domain-containing protein [Candidatus Hodarchaeota archaeon]
MEDSLKRWLADHDIQYVLHTHPAVFTVPEARIHCGHIPGTHCKNLFLKNKKSGQFYLVTIPHEKRLDLNKFRKLIGAPKVRFAEPEDLFEILGITSGAVSPIGLVNDANHKVIFMVDEDVWNAEEICCHPNINTQTLQIPGPEFRKLIKATETSIEIKNLPYLETSHSNIEG